MNILRKESCWQKASIQPESSPSRQQKFWLVLAGLWLQVVVFIFGVVEMQRRLHTPIRDWVQRIILLLSTG
jgi:hypothetical protein